MEVHVKEWPEKEGMRYFSSLARSGKKGMYYNLINIFSRTGGILSYLLRNQITLRTVKEAEDLL